MNELNDLFTPIHDPASPVRAASVVSRRRLSPIRTGHWLVAGILAAAFLAVIVAGGWLSESSTRGQWIWLAVVYAAVAATSLAVGPYATRAMLLEPEPLGAGDSAGRERVYDAYRATRIRVLYGLEVAMIVLMGTIFVAIVWSASDAAAWIGIAGGVLLGVAGAVAGTGMSLWRGRIARELASPG